MTYTLIACLLSAILYRMGGKGKPFNTKFRDLGCPTVLLGLVFILFGLSLTYWYLYLIAFGLSFGALTTYWDWLFDYDNFWFSGFMCGLAAIPLCWVIPWYWVVLRIIIITIGWGLWSAYQDNDVLEECGRGAFFIL